MAASRPKNTPASMSSNGSHPRYGARFGSSLGGHAVTRLLPYVQTGSSSQQRRGHNDTMLEFMMRRTQWSTARRNDIELRGIDAVRTQLGTARC